MKGPLFWDELHGEFCQISIPRTWMQVQVDEVQGLIGKIEALEKDNKYLSEQLDYWVSESARRL